MGRLSHSPAGPGSCEGLGDGPCPPTPSRRPGAAGRWRGLAEAPGPVPGEAAGGPGGDRLEDGRPERVAVDPEDRRRLARGTRHHVEVAQADPRLAAAGRPVLGLVGAGSLSNARTRAFAAS